MFSTRKLITAARTLHSSHVDELMEAFAEDDRARRERTAQRDARTPAAPAREVAASSPSLHKSAA